MAACENCTKGFVLPGEPTGSIIPEFNGAYLAKGPEGYTKRAVVYLSDMFGLPLVNSKIMADYLAKTLSCDVWAPDMFDGKPMATAAEMEPLMPGRASAPWTVSQKLRMYGKLIPRIFNVYSNRPAAVEARVIAFLEKLREEKKYDSVGAVGYCYGGMICVRIAPHSTLVDSLVICHPGEITAEQVKAMKVPSAWACAEGALSSCTILWRFFNPLRPGRGYDFQPRNAQAI